MKKKKNDCYHILLSDGFKDYDHCTYDTSFYQAFLSAKSFIRMYHFRYGIRLFVVCIWLDRSNLPF